MPLCPSLACAAALALGFPGSDQSPYGFIARLGRDTTSIERIRRTPTKVISDVIERSPHVVRRHSEATLAPDGSITRWVHDVYLLNTVPGVPSDQHFVAEFGKDSIRITTRSRAGTQRSAMSSSSSLTMPWLSNTYGSYELLFSAAQKRAKDSLTVTQYQPGCRPLIEAVVRFKKNYKLEFSTPELASVGNARMNSRGQLLSYSGAGPMDGQEVERLDIAPDIDAIAMRFAAVENSRGIVRRGSTSRTNGLQFD